MSTPPTGQSVADFLGNGDDTQLVSLADQHVLIATAMARTYTRGNGFVDAVGTEPASVDDSIAAVITTAAARMVANPEQVDTQTGSSSIRGGFRGWNLAELFILNSFRGTAR